MRAIITGIGSVVTALFASLCCVGPLVGALLGVSGLGAAMGLEIYRPYFLGATFVFLGSALYFTYGRRGGCIEEGVCEKNTKHRWQRILLWIVMIVALIFAFVPYLLPWLV